MAKLLKQALPARMQAQVPKSRNNLRRLISHVLCASGWRSAGQGQGYFRKAFDTDGKRIAAATWLHQVDAMLTRVCLPWFETIDSLRALEGAMRRNRYMGVNVDVRAAMKRRRKE